MWWHYLLVFLGAFLVDVSPFPLPPAFTLMVFLQIYFHLNIWIVVVLGVLGSIAGRYVLTLYIPHVTNKLFKRTKNEDVEFLGEKLKEKGWKSHLFVLIYSLLPLPTTPLFLAAGMAKLPPWYIIPAFFVGKSISDAAAVLLGKYAVESSGGIMENLFSWKSILGLAGGLLLIFLLIFLDWRTLIQKKKFKLKFKVWK